MSLKQRRLLYITFILLFITITPFFWLYAAGYKLGSGFKFEKTGIFIIDSEPRKAKIYLNNKLQKQNIVGIIPRPNKTITTPAKIKNLLPGEYSVRLEIENYWPWEKKLKINSGKSTFAEDIILFRNELPFKLLDGKYNSIITTLDSNLALTYNSKQVAIIDIKKSQVISRLSQASSSQYWVWSKDKKYISNGEKIFEAKNLNTNNNLPIIFKSIKKPLIWHNENKIFAISDDNIISYEPKSGKIQIFSQFNELIELKSDTNNLYAIKKNKNNSIISIINPDNGENKKNINLPLSSYKFLNQSPFLLDIYDTKHNILYLIDPSSTYKPLIETVVDAKNINWINQSQFVYTNGHEIRLIDLTNKQKILIARYSQKINNIFWHPSRNYIIFSTNEYIATIELDKRDRYNVTRLIDQQKIRHTSLSKDGSRLLLVGAIGQNEGVYELILQ
ncbi:MAG: PEGA domain-containing protein [Patescibacteria group bacterium]|nr:PEGA domain-containing protein [Patescibacteria group bacterium]